MTRFEITDLLNGSMMGFLEGTREGLRDSVRKRLSLRGLSVDVDCISIVCDDLPPRRMLSIHLDVNGEHYESVAVNIHYDTGWE